MKEISQNESSLFVDSVNIHQRLVNLLTDARDENNVSHLSQPK
jgi:hypothetical protein